MIISLGEAMLINPNVTQEDLDGIEEMIRGLTHNHFYNFNARFSIKNFSGNTLTVDSTVEGIQVGSTVEINHSMFNDELYLVREVNEKEIILDRSLIPESSSNAIVTLIQYPSDIYRGVTKLLKYDAKMGDKIGIKQERVSRWSVTYYDVGSGESSEGYPIALMKFIDKHRRLRWS